MEKPETGATANLEDTLGFDFEEVRWMTFSIFRSRRASWGGWWWDSLPLSLIVSLLGGRTIAGGHPALPPDPG